MPMTQGGANGPWMAEDGERSTGMLVLIVDDERDSLELCRMALEFEGHEVLKATEAAAALDLALRERPDVCVLDIMLPRVDGLSLLRTLREREETREIPVVLLTALSRADDELRGWEAGADLYVRKPYSTVGLVDAVERLASMTPAERRSERDATALRVGRLHERIQSERAGAHLSRGFELLTPTERRVADAVARGVSAENAHGSLGIGEATFWSHKRAIRRKLAVPRRQTLESFLHEHFGRPEGQEAEAEGNPPPA